MVAHDRNPAFTARQETLEQLANAFESPDINARRQAIVGLGGVGKTQIAVEYAHRFRNRYPHVFWMHGYSSEVLLAGFVTIASILNLGETSGEPTDTVNNTLSWFQKHKAWLLVVDNADDVTVLQPFLHYLAEGFLLVTSRSRDVQDIGILHPIEIKELTVNEASEFLLRRIGRNVLDAPEEQAVRELAEVLGGLPLALEQAGAYIVAKQTRVDVYLSAYSQMELAVLERNRASLGHYSKSVATTWALNIAEIERSSLAGEVLHISAFLAPDQIPLAVIAKPDIEIAESFEFIPLDFGSDELALDELLAELCRYSLIRRRPGSHSYDIHRLVQSVLRLNMTEEERQSWCCRALEILVLALPRPRPGQELGSVAARGVALAALVPHVLIACDRAQELNVVSLAAATLLNAAANYLLERGALREAANRFEQALQILAVAQVPETPYVATILNNLGHVKGLLGAYDAAEIMLEESLAMRTRLFGSKSVEVANSLNNLGTICENVGQLGQAAEFYERALLIREQLLGPEHLDVATSLNNVSLVRSAQYLYAEAEELLKRAYAIRREKLGAAHPETAHILCNLGMVHSELGMFSEAAAELLEALEVSETEFGNDHIQVARVLDRLAGHYVRVGRQNDALPLFLRALQIHERVLGKEHSDTIGVRFSLASAYFELGKVGEAESLLNIIDKRGTTGHDREILAVFRQLGRLSVARGDRELARQYFESAITAGERAFVDDMTMDEIRDALNHL